MGANHDEDELGEISQIYDLLKLDAKNLIGDLNDGVSQFRLSSRLMIYLSILGFFLTGLALFPQLYRTAWIGLSIIRILGPGNRRCYRRDNHT